LSNYLVSFFETEKGEQPVRTYLDRVGRSGQARELAMIHRQIDRLVEFGDALPCLGHASKHLVGSDGLYELRIGDHRIAYAAHNGGFVLLHAWRKQGRKPRTRDLERAKRNLNDWQLRETGRTRRSSHVHT